VQISTDHLFAGDRPFRGEGDAPAPLNAYARSKLAGERLVAERCPSALIVRTNFFGWGHALRKSISDWVIEGLRAQKRLRMFSDVFFTPILANRLARTVHALLEAGASGVVHVCGDERVSKHEFALRLAAAFGLPAAGIESSRYEDAGLAAPRPRDMSLSNARARAILGGGKLGGLDEFLAELRAQEASGLSSELQHAVTE
jgi:dTDP-4-dehydrorhamnose reductase